MEVKDFHVQLFSSSVRRPRRRPGFKTSTRLTVLGVTSHMTLHGSPGATGAVAAGGPLLLPISPSRLRPWKAPKKESSLAGARFLAGVACYQRQ